MAMSHNHMSRTSNGHYAAPNGKAIRWEPNCSTIGNGLQRRCWVTTFQHLLAKQALGLENQASGAPNPLCQSGGVYTITMLLSTTPVGDESTGHGKLLRSKEATPLGKQLGEKPTSTGL